MEGAAQSDLLRRAALRYAEEGWAVFPLHSPRDGACDCRKGKDCTSPAKHPRTRNGLKDASTELAKVDAWWRDWPNANIGIALPRDIVAVDLDSPDALDYFDAHPDWSLPETWNVTTGKGWHYIYRTPHPIKGSTGILPGIDLRGYGNYLVAPPSRHISGVVYRQNSSMKHIAAAPTWITNDHAAEAPADVQIDQDAPIPQGRRNDALASLGGAMRRYGANEATILAALVAENRRRVVPPLDDGEVQQIAHSVARYVPEPEPISIVVQGEQDGQVETLLEPEHTWPASVGPEAFHGALGDLVRTVEPYTEADPVGLLGCLLAYYSGLIGSKRTIHAGNWQQANLFVALVGDTSYGRKGVADGVAREIIGLLEPDYRTFLMPGLGSGEAIVGHMARLRDQPVPEERAIIRASELGGLLTVAAREGNNLSSTLRDAWDNVPIGRILADREKRVDIHHIALIGHVTPEELLNKLSVVERANGFGNRFLWLAVRRTQLLPNPPPVRDLVDGLWQPLHAGLLNITHIEGPMRWSADALTAWEDYYRERAEQPVYGAARALTARHLGQTVRLAMVYAIADSSEVIEAPHLAAGRAVAEYGERSVRYIFGDSTGNPDADAMLRMLRRGPLPWNETKRELGIRRAAEMDAAVQILDRLGLISVVEIRGEEHGKTRREIRARGANNADLTQEVAAS